MSYEYHEAANLFPLLTGKEYEVFKTDIEKNGLRNAIVLHDGKILDGRNRYRACLDTDVEPRFENYDGATPVAYVWSLNGARRHLSPTELGIIAHKMLPELRGEAKKRSEANLKHGTQAPSVSKETVGEPQGRATEQAAKIVGTSNATVNRVEYVAKRDPELYKKMEAGEITATQAVATIKERGEKSANKQPKAKRAEDITRLANEGYRAAQIADELGIGEQQVRNIAKDCNIELPDAAIGKSHRANPRRMIEATVYGLEGYAQGIRELARNLEGIEPGEAAAWAESMKDSLKSLQKLRRQLLEIANDN